MFLLMSVSVACLLSCKKKEEAPSAASTAPAETARYTGVPASAPAAAPAKAEGKGAREETARKIILTHNLGIEVKKVEDAIENVSRLATSSGGYVFQTSRNSLDRNASWGKVGIRVPAGKAGTVLTSIRGIGRVDNENSSAEDITEEYVDMDARLRNAQASETRLKEMYQRAGTIKDVLAVEKELTRVRGDIEAFMARKRNFDLLTEMVTIEVTVHEPSAALPAARTVWEPLRSAFGKAAEVFANSLRALIVFVGMITPWLVIIIPGYVLLKRGMKRWKSRKKGSLQSDQ